MLLLTRVAPVVTSRTRTLINGVRTITPVIYTVLVRPLNEKTQVYTDVCNEVDRDLRTPEDERMLMKQYLWSLQFGDKSVPAGLDDLRACAVRQMIAPSRHALRVAYPLRTWHWRKQEAA